MGPGERLVWIALAAACWIFLLFWLLSMLGPATCSANQPC